MVTARLRRLRAFECFCFGAIEAMDASKLCWQIRHFAGSPQSAGTVARPLESCQASPTSRSFALTASLTTAGTMLLISPPN
jgi:hypothetical protein